MKTWCTALYFSLFALTTSVSHADTQTVTQNLKLNFPEIAVTSVNNTPVKDIYEVYMGGQIVYTNEDAKYFFTGNLIDLKAKKNLTEEREQVLTRIEVKSLPLNQAIKHVKGNGERTLYIFSDPDCPYCQKLEHELLQVDNVTLYLFLDPITSLHPNSGTIAQQIWCSKDQYQAWQDYLLNKKAPVKAINCKTPIEKNIQLAKTIAINGTPTFFLQDGSRISGARSASDLETLLKTVK